MNDRESKNIILDTLQLTDPNAVIEMCNQSTKIQNVLFALLNSRVIREKRKGEGMPQASITG
jgi:transcription initiation factor IIE alpha subunit